MLNQPSIIENWSMTCNFQNRQEKQKNLSNQKYNDFLYFKVDYTIIEIIFDIFEILEKSKYL
jgi:hypothetical protein